MMAIIRLLLSILVLLVVLSTRQSCSFLMPTTTTRTTNQHHRQQWKWKSPNGRIIELNNSNHPLHMQRNGMDDSPDSTARRQLLYSLLAAAGGGSLAATPSIASAVAQEDAASTMTETTAATTSLDWSTISVLKPPTDDRDYRLTVLENGLRVILCSDASSNEAGAAMDVHVGACSDPKDIPGLAHFNEHMLFLGTKEYPNEDSFEGFLSANGGSSNAYTASEDTVYHFTLQAEADSRLEEGLKRFGSFFTSPLFTESATGRELNAIESENAKNLQSDGFRIYQINKERQNAEHPHSKFFTGNKKTLLEETKRKGIDLRQSLIDFYSMYYSADQMTLAVVGPQSLDTLNDMAKSAFSNIPNNNVGPPEAAWKRIISPFDNGKSRIPSFGHVAKIVPVQDIRQATITWPIVYKNEDDRSNALLTKQAQYISHVVGHEGPGSLLSYLKQQGWANSLESSGEENLSDFETFEVTVGLTKAGLNNVDNVVEAVFSCIGMLRDKTIPDYIFNEVLQLEELQWRYSSKGGVGSYVQSLATTLREYPPSLCVAGPRRLALCSEDSTLLASSKPRTKFDSKGQLAFTKGLSTDFVDNLTVDNAMLTVLSKSFKGQTNQKEEWYGTDFRVGPIPEGTLQKWRSTMQPKELGITFPRKNVFIPSEAGLKVKYPPKPGNGNRPRTFEEKMIAVPPPEIIRDDGPEGRWTVYYKPDKKFGQPKAFVIFQLLTQKVYSSPTAAALSNMYEFSLTDKLGEYAYDAGLAGLTYDIRIVPRGVRLTLGGYNDKLQTFASYLSKKISTDMKDILPKDEAEFERYKDILTRTFAAFDVKQPYQHCSYFSQLMTQPTAFQFTNQELLDATEAATLGDLMEYVSSIWTSGKGVALVQGNVEEKEAQTLVTTIDKALGFQTISANEYPPELEPLPLPQSPANAMSTRLSITEPNEENGNAASYVVIQSLSTEPKEHVLIELVSSIVSEPFYEELRTRQQLGYIVSSGVKPVGKTKTMGFIVQSSTAKNKKLTEEIIKYMDKIRSDLEKVKEGDFAVYVKSLIDRKTEPEKTLAAETTRNWAEIASGRFEFDRTQREVSALLSLEQEDLLEFWDNFYVKDGRRVLITEMIPQVGVSSSPAPPKSTGYTPSLASMAKSSGLVLGIDDIQRYRSEREKLLSRRVDLEKLA